MVAAGSLRQSIRIEKRGPARDAAGQPVKNGWLPVATVRADIRHTGGLEAIRSDAPTSIVQASIRIRYRTDLTAGMRVVHGATVYDVQAVLPDLQARRHVDLVCKVVSGG